MKLNLFKIIDINSSNMGTITIEDSSDNFGHARELHNFLINNNYVAFDHIEKIEILRHNFIFYTRNNITFHFVER